MTCTPEPLNPVFLQLGPISIYWYGLIIATGAFLGLWIATRETERLGLKKDYMVDIVVFAIPAAIVCARLYYVIFEWDRYAGGPWWKVFAVWEGGIAIHGALIGSVLTAYLYTKIKGLSFWRMADIAAPSIILGQAIGRWGNFMNQEAHGGPVSESFYNHFMQYLPGFINQQMCIDGTIYHPTFLYESVWNIIGFVLLLALRHKFNPRRGEVFLSYVIWYSVGRFFIEGMRTDSLYLFGEIRTAQFISILLVIGAIVLITFRRKSGMADKYYNGKNVK
ncbi:prolipoprotein diacylglyceryl transferase [Halobacillus karajensis]|uniref:Phosphatidylglycerol--prolipoprotein diacylglyceryl transferase n=1 Tax=Halobacillus karajensis TaxID=195088 RepID=A0A059NXZ8_9BACI|nr:prolipoprotein diacylglyceryl transferase [Halobacillus karajensis]CDQ19240.1 Prolipoprotein diacylglyceryl transferase [Halobacillus karajensis]CDQ22686.1 Prolipoprotein diacylglyceryl transferase [Halobacillus karajensis]CDQ26168.1 Prolipoprotein diacylglyceryl transferase [Halobacillus karajensis]